MKILGLGDNVVDKYLHTRVMYPGGNAFNIAALAKLSGVDAGYLGVFGDDEMGMHVLETARELGVDVSMCRFYHGENGYTEVELRDGDRVFVGSNGGGVSKEHPIRLNEADKKYIAGFDVCHTSVYSYAEDALPDIRDASPFVSMDFSDEYDDEYLKKSCPYLDMAEISCSDMPEEGILKTIDRIRSYGCRQIVLATRGSKGSLVSVNGEIYEQPPCLVQATDTMAAGDSFITSFLIHFIGAHEDIIASLFHAAVSAAENCRREGSFGFGKSF